MAAEVGAGAAEGVAAVGVLGIGGGDIGGFGIGGRAFITPIAGLLETGVTAGFGVVRFCGGVPIVFCAVVRRGIEKISAACLRPNSNGVSMVIHLGHKAGHKAL